MIPQCFGYVTSLLAILKYFLWLTVLWQVYFRLELMYADALRARRQVLLGNEQVEEKGQDQGAVAEIVFCGAVRSHSGEPSLCH